MPPRADGADPLLQASRIHVHFRLPAQRKLRALDGVDLCVDPGEIVGIVGESGCGKSTLARTLVGLVPRQAGEIRWRGRTIDMADAKSLRVLRREVQMVFQDPFSSLDPRLTIEASVVEPLTSARPELSRMTRRDLARQWLVRAGLDESLLSRYPHELSGGQCQRVAIARAVIIHPALLICDEAVSALDVSVQAQILQLLRTLQSELQMALLFISHHLIVVSQLAERVLVLYLGRVVESGPAARVLHRPLHPYTRALIDAVPVPDPTVERSRPRATLKGELPSPVDPPSGCVFRTRCAYAIAVCAERVPEEEEGDAGHRVACHRWREWQTGNG
ncbi:MAG TPA: oligopeptide/dipeptide ABC transporter ATP-binding protein [Steroidobacteraceae bacterium]|nr:oligopeptide/dipeptide ABC transporter ATP-binding protein [Steroidobacteraceae bacterium]